jgi:predicted DNA-binding protein (MmcQ/YjbR family)
MLEEIRLYCAGKPEVTESFPFDETTLVFKTKGKMFALLNLEPPFSINLKCNPEYAIELREEHEGITPGYHMNKKHWNTVRLDMVSQELVQSLIDHSFELIYSGKKTSK